MTKAKTKGERRRAARDRRAAAPFDYLAPVIKRTKRGKARMAELRHEAINEDTQPLEVRARRAGIDLARTTPDEREAHLRDMRAPWWGCPAGRAMAGQVTADEERKRLWDAIQLMRRVQLAFDRSIGAPSRHAACLRLMLPHDPLTATAASPAFDIRTDEERAIDARKAMRQMQGWLRECGAAVGAAKATILDDAECKQPKMLIAVLRVVANKSIATTR